MPWHNIYAESFGSTIREKLLYAQLCGSLAEAQVMTADEREDYNER